MRALDRANMYPRSNTLIACHGFDAAVCLAAWASPLHPHALTGKALALSEWQIFIG